MSPFRPDFSSAYSPDEFSGEQVQPGEVYWIPRELYDPQDEREGHPFVVLRGPTSAQPYVLAVMRNSKPPRVGPGLAHAADPKVRLDLPGWFTLPPKTIPGRQFREYAGVSHLTTLTAEEFDRVQSFVKRGAR